MYVYNCLITLDIKEDSSVYFLELVKAFDLTLIAVMASLFLYVFLMTKAVSNRDIFKVKAALSLWEDMH